MKNGLYTLILVFGLAPSFALAEVKISCSAEQQKIGLVLVIEKATRPTALIVGELTYQDQTHQFEVEANYLQKLSYPGPRVFSGYFLPLDGNPLTDSDFISFGFEELRKGKLSKTGEAKVQSPSLIGTDQLFKLSCKRQ